MITISKGLPLIKDIMVKKKKKLGVDFALTMTSDSEIKFKITAHLYQRLIARAHGGKLGLDKDFTQVCYDLDIYIYRKLQAFYLQEFFW